MFSDYCFYWSEICACISIFAGSCNTYMLNLEPITENIRSRSSALSVSVNGDTCDHDHLTLHLERALDMDCAKVISKLRIEYRQNKHTKIMTRALCMLNHDVESPIHDNADFVAGVYNQFTHALDTHSSQLMPMVPPMDDNTTISSTHSGMPDGVSAWLPAFLVWKTGEQERGVGLRQGCAHLLAAHDMNAMFKKLFAFVVERDIGWLIYLKNNLEDSFEAQLHFMRLAVKDIAPLWFAIHAEAESDPDYIYNRYTAELLLALRALKVEWQWSRIQLLGMSASWVYVVSPGDSQSTQIGSKAQFALKFNPSQERCDREIESVRRLAFEYASGTNADAQLYYACGVVSKDGATEFFQPSKLKNGVENSLRIMLESIDTPAPVFSSRGRRLKSAAPIQV